MKERPILFSSPMVRAILDGRKTQTRRVVKSTPVPWNHDHTAWDMSRCPYGQPDDRLWVREAFMHEPADYCWEASVSIPSRPKVTVYRADSDPNSEAKGVGWKPSIHMPRVYSRILLEIVAVRVERLNDISVSDAIAEGYDGSLSDPVDPSIQWYSQLWESINGAGSWAENPWVWVVEFKRGKG